MSNPSTEKLSEYERAIYYYTIPRVTRTVPVGVLVVYVFLNMQTIIAIAYGINTDKTEWVQGGGIVLGILVLGGVVTYLSREFIHELQERRANAIAKTMPDVDSQFDEIPDPFGEHILLRYPARQNAAEIAVTNNKGQNLYSAQFDAGGKSLRVTDHEDTEIFTATLERQVLSFSVETGSPSRIEVVAGDEPVAKVQRRSNFGPAHVDIECLGGDPQTYEFRGSGIYRDEELVGRIYEVRQYLYLDIQKAHFRDGILSFFVTLSR